MSNNPAPVNALAGDSNAVSKPKRQRRRNNNNNNNNNRNSRQSKNPNSRSRNGPPTDSKSLSNNESRARARFRDTDPSSPQMIPATLMTNKKIASLIKEHFPPAVIQAIRQLMLPAQHWGRYPGNAHQPTAVTRSLREFPVFANFSDPQPGMAGRFSFVVSPTLGSNSTNPKDWSVSLIDTSAGFPIDLTQAGYYIIGAAGPVSSDNRLDPNFSALTQPTVGMTTGNWMQQFTPVAVATPLLSIPLGNPIVGNSGLYPIIGTNAITNNSTINLPVGQYLVQITNVAPVGAAATPLAVTGFAGAVVDPISSQNWQEIPAPNPEGNQSIYNITIPTTDSYIEVVTPFVNQLTALRIDIAPGFFPNRTPIIPMNGGLVKGIRCTGLSVLFSCTISSMYAGGEIACNLVSNEVLKTDYFINGAQSSLAMWENLAKIAGRPSYQGVLPKGCYGFFVPLDITQTKFVPPGELNSIGMPQLVVSGAATNAANLTGNQQVGKVEICATYEYVTESLIPNTCYTEGSLQMVDSMLNAFDQSMVACENPTHKSKIGGFISKLPKVMSDVNGVIQAGKSILSSFGI